MATLNRAVLSMAMAQALAVMVSQPQQQQEKPKMKVRIEAVSEGEKGPVNMEILLIDKGAETVLGGLGQAGDFQEVDIEFPQAIVVRPASV